MPETTMRQHPLTRAHISMRRITQITRPANLLIRLIECSVSGRRDISPFPLPPSVSPLLSYKVSVNALSSRDIQFAINYFAENDLRRTTCASKIEVIIAVGTFLNCRANQEETLNFDSN